LNLLLEWPLQRSRQQWTAIFAASVAVHILFLAIAVRFPGLVAPGTSRPPEERTVVRRRVKLYMPRELITQKAPNRHEISKHIDLADLLASHQKQASPSAPRPSVKKFELPKQAQPRELAKNMPQILPQAPNVQVNPTPAAPPPGVGSGMPVPPPPAPSSGPFQNIGSDVPPNPHPTLAPPKTNLESPMNGTTQKGNGSNIVISDDSATQPMTGSPGTIGQAGAQHAAVELQSDPQGADFKPYLAQILAIVRANWRKVIPMSARMGMLRGRTTLEFIISRNGSIPKLVLADSSGVEPLDRAAIAGLSMSNPLPPLPADYKGFQVRLAFSFAYNMPSQ